MSHNSESQQQRYMGESYEQQERFTRTKYVIVAMVMVTIGMGVCGGGLIFI